MVYAGTEREQCRELIDIALRELTTLKREPVLQDELDSAREQLKGNLLMSLENSDNLMSRLAKNEIYLGRNQTVEEVLACFDAVSTADLLRLANELFDGSCLNVEVMGKADGLGLTTEMLRF